MNVWSGILEPGAQPPVDLLPLLKYVPTKWAKWKVLCKQVKEHQYQLYEGFVNMVEERLREERGNGSFLEGVVGDTQLGSDRMLVR